MDDDVIKDMEASFICENTYGLVRQSAEIVFDCIDALRGIPVFSTILKFIDLTKNFLLRRLAKKIYKLLFNLQGTTEEEREKFLRDLESSNKENASEVLLEMIDRLNNINKVDVLSKLMIAKIKEKITIENFVRLGAALERIPYPDLFALKKYAKCGCDEFSAVSLLSAGMLSNNLEWIIPEEESAENDRPYHLTPLGKLMMEYGLT